MPRKFLFWLGKGLLLFAMSAHAVFSTVWYAEGDSLGLVDPNINQTVVAIPLSSIRALAVDSSGPVWALTKKRLLKYQPDGVAAVDVELKGLLLKGADKIAIAGRDGSLWVVEGKEDDENEDDDGDGKGKRVVRLNSLGERIQDFISPGRVRGLMVSLDQTLWLLGNKTLWHYSATGVLLANIDLKAVTGSKPKIIAVDAIGAWLWLSEEKKLWRLGGEAPTTISTLKISLDKKSQSDFR